MGYDDWFRFLLAAGILAEGAIIPEATPKQIIIGKQHVDSETILPDHNVSRIETNVTTTGTIYSFHPPARRRYL